MAMKAEKGRVSIMTKQQKKTLNLVLTYLVIYLATRTFETIESGCIAVIFAWVFDVRVMAYVEAQVILESQFSVIVNGHFQSSFLIDSKRGPPRFGKSALKQNCELYERK